MLYTKIFIHCVFRILLFHFLYLYSLETRLEYMAWPMPSGEWNEVKGAGVSRVLKTARMKMDPYQMQESFVVPASCKIGTADECKFSNLASRDTITDCQSLRALTF